MGRRAHDGLWGRLGWLWRQGVPVVAIGLAAYSVVNIQSDVDRQREGRKVAVNVVCGATSAVIDAGRATITGGGQTLNPRFARNLERLGYPSRKQREVAAEAAAKAYAKQIADRVAQQSGVRGMVRRDGSLNCDRLSSASLTQEPDRKP